MATALPPRPHLGHLRRQARELLRAMQAGQPAALARAAGLGHAARLQLATAQRVIAHEHGFASWPRLVAEVERLAAAALPDAAFVEQVLTLALGHGHEVPHPERALALATSRRVKAPSLDLPLRLVQGELAAVQRALSGADVNAPLPPWHAPPIVYAACSALARLESHRTPLVAMLAWLLQQGANPNATWRDPAFPDDPLPVLYGATARASCLETTQLLLQAGADPNDGESLYHATEQADRRLLQALVQAGARWTGTNALLRQLDHDDLPGLQQALALGADPNETGPGGVAPLHHALMRGRGLPFVQALIAHGAQPQALDGAGRTVAWHAARLGDEEVLALLAQRGVAAPTGERESFLAACAAADEAAARAHLARHPSTLATLDDDALRLLPDQAQRGRLASVRLMLALGWPVAVRGDWQASALNQAAFRGDAVMVALLMAHGARWDEPNGFGGDVLGSCLYAASELPAPGADYAAVLELLLAQGAPAPSDPEKLPEALQAVLPQ